MTFRTTAALVATLVISCACGRRGTASVSEPKQVAVREFPTVSIPSVYTDPQERTDYAAKHFWDAFLSTSKTYLCDSTTVNGVSAAEVEQLFANYVSLLLERDCEVGRSSVESLFAKLEALQTADPQSNVFERFASLADKYLYDANSPYRDEDLYAVYVKGLAASALTDPSMVPAYANDARLCGLNARGTAAADFVFKDIKGRSRTLYSVKADYTLLFFSNPGCEACKEIILTLRDDPGLSHLVETGRLAVVNVYIDEDLEAWRGYQDFYPKNWYNGYDPTYTIRKDLSYHVRAIPSLYLLDSDKRVLLKDAPEGRLYSALQRL